MTPRARPLYDPVPATRHLPRPPRSGARSRAGWGGRIGMLALASVPAAGCIDFLDPNLPPPGPAVAQVALFLEDHTGSTSVDVRVSVIPGMGQSGDFRKIPNDTLIVNGLKVRATTVHNNGTRDYQATIDLPGPSQPAAAGPVVLQFPTIAGIDESPPELRWYALRRLDLLASVALTPAGDLFLHVDTTKPPEAPVPANPQWVLQLSTPAHAFQLGADGSPPTTLHVPAEFVPADTSSFLTASLLIAHGAQLTSGAEYILNASLSQRLNWTVLRKAPPP